MSGKVLVNANRLITDFITSRIPLVKCLLTLTGDGKNGALIMQLTIIYKIIVGGRSGQGDYGFGCGMQKKLIVDYNKTCFINSIIPTNLKFV